MSLEIEIQKLTAEIQKLNKNLILMLTTPADQLLKIEPEQTPTPVAAPTEFVAAAPVAAADPAPASFTQDDLRRLCMAKVKEDRTFKDTLKDFLSRVYGVTKTSDVPDDKVQEAYLRIESGNL